MVGEGLVRTGVAAYQVGVWLTRLAGASETRLLVLLMLAVAGLGVPWGPHVSILPLSLPSISFHFFVVDIRFVLLGHRFTTSFSSTPTRPKTGGRII